MLRSHSPRTVSIVFLLLLTACRDAEPPTTPTGLERTAEPAAGAAYAAEEGFAFLSPLVRGTKPEGDLDRALSPVVEVCRPAGLGCSLPLVARFTTEGKASERVRLEEDEGEHYHVNWHTGRFELDADQVYRIRVRVGGSTLGQLDVALVEKGGGKKRGGDDQATVMLGSTVPVRFWIARGAVPPPGPPLPVLHERAQASGVIGPEGGTLTASDQGVRYTLEIPAGALPDEQTIAMTPLLGVHNFPLTGGIAAGVDLQPDGLTLYRAATLTIELPPGHDPGMVVGFGYVDGGEIFYARPVSLSGSIISMPVHHFSGAGAAGATVVDLEQIIAKLQALGRTLPSKLYPAALVVAQVRLFAQVCGGPPKNCTPNEADQVRDEYQRLLIDVLHRWYADGLVPILADATTDDRALEFAAQEFFTWVGTLLISPSIPPTLDQVHEEGRDHLARGIRESIERFAEDCRDTRVLGRWKEAELADLLGREEIPADELELARRYTCLSFDLDHPASMQAGELVELKLRILHEVGGVGEFLPWPNRIQLFVVNGCGVVDGVRFLNDVHVPQDPSRPAEVQVTADEDDPDCEEVEIAVSTHTWVPRPHTTHSPPLNGVVFGAEDTVRIPIGTRRLLFAGRDGAIYVVASDGSRSAKLTSGHVIDPSLGVPVEHDRYPAWSPDGRRIAFARDGDLRTMDADGSNQRRIISGNSPPTNANPDHIQNRDPAWSPDGGRIAFVRYESIRNPDGPNDVNQDIITVNADGSGLARLVTEDYWEQSPTWSPDGTRIAHDARNNKTFAAEIHVVNPDGSGRAMLSGASAFGLDWSSQNRIAFSTLDGSILSLHVMNGNGSARTRIFASASVPVTRPAWSPDGERVAFISNSLAGPFQTAVFVMNADGTGVTEVPGTIGAQSLDW